MMFHECYRNSNTLLCSILCVHYDGISIFTIKMIVFAEMLSQNLEKLKFMKETKIQQLYL